MKLVDIIKKFLLVVVVFTLVATSFFIPGFEISAASSNTKISKSSTTGINTPVKEVFPINDGWKFNRVPRAERSDKYFAFGFDDSGWEEITAPHTWWKTASGETKETDMDYGYYRKKITLSEDMKGGQVWIEFEAAAHFVEVRVNDLYIGQHFGGYTKFRFNLNSAINQVGWGKEFVITIMTDAHHGDTPPVGGGFNKFPGITGNVNLIYTPSVYAALDDYGSSGIYVTPEVTDKAANNWNVSVDTIVTNITSAKNVKVKTTIRDMDKFENIGIDESLTPFDESTMYGNKVYYAKEETISVVKGKTNYSLDIPFSNPRLWNGRQDPYRYALDFEIYDTNGTLLDKVTECFGFRYFEITKDGGFFLNGKSYPLRGVAYHEDYEGTGSAMNKEQWDDSFKLVYELGGTFSRLSHYPHDPYSYELCDRYGIVVWAEIGMISGVSYSFGGTTNILPAFKTRAENHLRELIRQNKNHPSIVVWGLENELEVAADVLEETNELMNRLNAIAKEEDPTRLTTQTAGLHHKWANWEVDVTAFNFYPMWYGEGNFEAEYQRHRARMDKEDHFKDMALGFVEYGAGAGVADYQHSEYPERPEKTTVNFHPAEWQNIVHEEAIKMINNHPELWVASLWCMFDFACDPFNEGDTPGINDKGLVTRDRKTKKDTFYLYQANWMDSDVLPVIHITSSGMTEREVQKNTVTVYSNLDSIELFRDGKSLGKRNNDGNGIFVWENVSFGNIGETHTYTAKSGNGEEIAKYSGVNEVKWTRVASEKLDIDINREGVYVNQKDGVIVFSGKMDAVDINKIFTSKYNAEIKLVEADGKTPVVSGIVKGNTKLIVTAESGDTNEFVLCPSSIAIEKKITTSNPKSDKIELLNNGEITDMSDGNADRWTTSKDSTGWIMIDLEDSYVISNVTLHLFKGWDNTRQYYYNVFAGETEDSLELVVDRSANNTIGTVSDNLSGVKGRYVKIEFLGSNQEGAGKFVGVDEIEISGYILSSTEIEFDHENKTIMLPYEWSLESEKIQPDKIYNDIKVKGNAYISVKSDTYYVDESTKLVVYNFTGGETEYTVSIVAPPPYAGDTYSSLAWLILMLTSGSVLAIAFISRRKATR